MASTPPEIPTKSAAALPAYTFGHVGACGDPNCPVVHVSLHEVPEGDERLSARPDGGLHVPAWAIPALIRDLEKAAAHVEARGFDQDGQKITHHGGGRA